MAGSLKKTIQDAVLYPRKIKFNKEYLKALTEYDEAYDKIIETIKSDDNMKKVSDKVDRIHTDAFRDKVVSKELFVEDKYYVIYDSQKGILLPECETVIAEYLSDNPYALVMYGDEDYVPARQNGEGYEYVSASRRVFRYFKPCYSPETLASFNYMNVLVLKGEIINIVEDRLDTSADNAGLMYNLAFEVCAIAVECGEGANIVRIPRVLYSNRMVVSDEIYNEISSNGNGADILKNEFEALPLNCGGDEYDDIRLKGSKRLHVERTERKPSVSVIIPSKDNPVYLGKCINSLRLKNDDPVEVIIVDNGSNEANRNIIHNLLAACDFKHKYIYNEEEFNYSKMNNEGVKEASGEVLLLLNDDIEAPEGDWLQRITAEALKDGVGCVGCKLLYPDGKIQHVGIACGVDGPAHVHMGEEDRKMGYGDNLVNRNVLAVTGACLAVKKSLYEDAEGLCEELKVGYNDVDFCLKLAEEGYRNVLLNEIKLTHYESVSRGKDAADSDKAKRLREEKDSLIKRHKDYMFEDPYDGSGDDYLLDAEKNKSDSVEILIPKTEPRKATDSEGWIYSHFDKFDINEEQILEVSGYALVPGMDNMRFDFDMILEKEGKQTVLSYSRTLRRDVDGKFNGTENTGLSGMNFKVSLSDLESGEYAVKFYAKDHGNVREIITDVGRRITI